MIAARVLLRTSPKRFLEVPLVESVSDKAPKTCVQREALLYEQVIWGQRTHRVYVQLCIQTNRGQREVGNFLQRCVRFGQGKQRSTHERRLPPANTSAIGHCTLRQPTHLERRGRVDEGGKRSQRERRER